MNFNLNQNATKITLLHIAGMMGLTLFFSIFFQLEGTPQWIRDNIHHVPNGQMLAYGVIFGVYLCIFTTRIITKPEYSIKTTTSNVFKLSVKALQDFTTVFVDLVSITVIVYTFFQVGFDLDGDSIVSWSTFCSLTVFPYLAFFTYLLLNNPKLDYGIPIFTKKF